MKHFLCLVFIQIIGSFFNVSFTLKIAAWKHSRDPSEQDHSEPKVGRLYFEPISKITTFRECRSLGRHLLRGKWRRRLQRYCRPEILRLKQSSRKKPR